MRPCAPNFVVAHHPAPPPPPPPDLFAPGAWLLLLLARSVHIMGALLLVLAGLYVLNFAHVWSVRLFAADLCARWIPFLWSGGWRIHPAVVLGGTARDPQLLVGSMHSAATAAPHAHFSNVTQPLLIYLPYQRRCTLLQLQDHVVGLHARAHFDRADAALEFLRALAPNIALTNARAAAPSSNSSARPLRLNALAPAQPSNFGARVSDAVELRLAMLPAGAPLLVAHMSWSLFDVLRVLLRARRLPLRNTDVDMMLPPVAPASRPIPADLKRVVFVAKPDDRQKLIECLAPIDLLHTNAIGAGIALFASFLARETAIAFERLARA
jgi:hypothetical protein